MPDKPQAPEVKPVAAEGAPEAPVTPPAPRRGPGHRGADVRDTVAEMTEKAQQLSLEAGSKVAAAMKDVIHAAAGITGFAMESARDLVQYMVRRGQMRPEEAEKLLREVEEAQGAQGVKRPPPRIERPEPKPEARYEPPRAEPRPETAPLRNVSADARTAGRPPAPAAKAAPPKPAAKAAPPRPAAKPPAKAHAKPASKASRPAAKAPAKKPAPAKKKAGGRR
jgi:hypothetical protein